MRWIVLVAVLVAGAGFTRAADDAKANTEYQLANYTKFEYRIPMRDGVSLFTVVFVPKDTSKTYPIMIHRTPYGVGPYGPDFPAGRWLPSPLFWKSGYIFVNQDVRGRLKSGGTFVHGRPHIPAKKTPADVDESSDAYDTIDWLIKNIPGHNGRVGMEGISYPGFYAACGMIDAHPALKAVSPQAPVIDFFDGDDCRHNGAFLLAHNFNFFGQFRKLSPKMYTWKDPREPEYGTEDGYRFFLDLGPLSNSDKYLHKSEPFWADQMAHPDYDEFCQARNLRPHIKAIRPAVLTVGGWYDAEDLAGTLNCYQRVAASSPDCPQNVLVMGPWVHGGWSRGDGDALGPVKFHAKTSEYYREKVELPFFEQHLKGVAPATTLPKAALMYETGTNRWRRFDTWPPAEARKVTFHFAADGALITTSPPAGDGFDEYVSDPARPVPSTERPTPRMEKEYMTADQRFAGQRPDVLVYQSPVLTEDVCVAGPIEVSLHVSTTGTDSDFVVKLIDVYPDDYPGIDPNPANLHMGGYQQLVRGEPFRGKYRNSLAKPEPFEPGKPATIRFTLPDVSHSFRSGHRIMVQVQSSWFPLIDRNPQTFCDIPKARPEDFRKATQRVYRSTAMPSGVTFRVIKP
ncbi:MAG: CocE/NonD family hydrolase [Gemmataceae bacterium]|nr:CocE/NonD family hydrolase [Gemmataceae bacterium]